MRQPVSTPAKAQALAGKGAKAAATPREAAEDADCIFAMVADDAASRAVWLGADGALAGAKPNAVVVESSTLTPDWVRELGAKAQERGCRFLDAPVGGSRTAGREHRGDHRGGGFEQGRQVGVR